MKHTVNRPVRIEMADVDGAIEQALQRVAQVQQLSAEQCQSVSGGTLSLVSSKLIYGGFQNPIIAPIVSPIMFG